METREGLLKDCCNYNTRLQLLIATTVFGMGVDCPGVKKVINWGCPNTLEEKLVEVEEVKAILYPKLGKDVICEIKNYAKNSRICRRKKISFYNLYDLFV